MSVISSSLRLPARAASVRSYTQTQQTTKSNPSSPYTTATSASPSLKTASPPISMPKSSSHVSSPAVFSKAPEMFMLDSDLQLGDSAASKDSTACGRSLTGIASSSVYSSADVAPAPSARARTASISSRFGSPLMKPEAAPAAHASEPVLTALEPLEAIITSHIGWVASPDAEAIMEKAMADVYGTSRTAEAQETAVAATEVAAATAEATVSPEVATTTAAEEEAALWAAAAKYETENFDDEYVTEYHKRRQESDGRPRAQPKPEVNRAQLFAEAQLADAANVSHVYYRSESNYDCDRSPQVRVPAKEQR